jgi:hypothetical protein
MCLEVDDALIREFEPTYFCIGRTSVSIDRIVVNKRAQTSTSFIIHVFVSIATINKEFWNPKNFYFYLGQVKKIYAQNFSENWPGRALLLFFQNP